jgi:hypothetical protein
MVPASPGHALGLHHASLVHRQPFSDDVAGPTPSWVAVFIGGTGKSLPPGAEPDIAGTGIAELVDRSVTRDALAPPQCEITCSMAASHWLVSVGCQKWQKQPDATRSTTAVDARKGLGTAAHHVQGEATSAT